MKEITLITQVVVNFSDIVDERVIAELVKLVGGIGHDNIPFTLDWSNYEECPRFRKFLITTYGQEIKKHESFLLLCC